MLVRVLLVGGAVALVAWRVDWAGALQGVRGWSVPVLAVALTAFTASAALKAVIWAGLLRGVRPGDDVRSRDLLSPVFIGLLGNWALPARLGEAVRVGVGHRRLLRRGAHVGLPVLAGAVAAEILVSTLAFALLGLVAAAALPVPAYVAAIVVVTAAACGALVVVALRDRRPPPADPPATRWARVARPVRESLRSAAAGLRALRRPGPFGVVAGAAAGAVALQWCGTLLTLEAVGIGAGAGAAAAVLVTTTVAQALPLLPGGLGSFQAAAALPLIASYGVSPAAAIAFAVVLHAGQALTGVLPGLVFLAREDIDLRGLRASGGTVAAGPDPAPSGS
jgi:uncharacterized membrane protein YbhN (UPF0104 family)